VFIILKSKHMKPAPSMLAVGRQRKVLWIWELSWEVWEFSMKHFYKHALSVLGCICVSSLIIKIFIALPQDTGHPLYHSLRCDALELALRPIENLALLKAV
jgi:hypothetical protein